MPYPWLAPNLAIKQAGAICKHLVRIYPERKSQFTVNLKSLCEGLRAVEKPDLGSQPRQVISLSPSPGHLTRWLGVDDSHLLYFTRDEIEDSTRLRNELSDLQKKTSAQVLLTCYVLPAEVQKIADELGLRVVNVDLLESTPAGGDEFMALLRRNIQSIAEALNAGG